MVEKYSHTNAARRTAHKHTIEMVFCGAKIFSRAWIENYSSSILISGFYFFFNIMWMCLEYLNANKMCNQWLFNIDEYYMILHLFAFLCEIRRVFILDAHILFVFRSSLFTCCWLLLLFVYYSFRNGLNYIYLFFVCESK